MKKSKHFIALFGAVALFFLFPAISYAGYYDTYDCPTPISTYTISAEGSFEYTGGKLHPENSVVYFGEVKGAYGAPSVLKGDDAVSDFYPSTPFDVSKLEAFGDGDYTMLLCPTYGCSTENPCEGYIALNVLAGVWNGIPSEPAINILTPETGTTITDTSTLLTGEWISIDSTTWTDIKIVFNDYQISGSSKIVYVALDADDGDFSIPLSDFEITNNGGWTLTAIVENEYEYNFDIPNPTYALIFDVDGLPTPYAFTGFEDWYDTNVPNYEEPSDWALNMIGFLQPIFEKVGEYGNRIETYLDITEAYEKGFQIGGVFPIVIVYVEKIDLFFGGFPIAQFFKWIVIVMIGLFGVKTILKLLSFIPFFGGSG
jgi:hypothetical protein